MNGPYPKQSICYSDCIIISHRSLGSTCDPNPTSVFCFVEYLLLILAIQQLKYLKDASHFKAVREAPPPNNTFTKTANMLELASVFQTGKYLEHEVPSKFEAET